VLVHFGDDKFLSRYNQFEKLLPEWRQQYPKLAAADMRYQGQIVLEMRKDGDAVAPAPVTTANAPVAATKPAVVAQIPAAKPAAPSATLKPAVVRVAAVVPAKKPVAKKAVAKKSKPAAKPAAKHVKAGASTANDKFYAELAAQRKKAAR
jgi:cell division protein FtsQ